MEKKYLLKIQTGFKKYEKERKKNGTKFRLCSRIPYIDTKEL